jgi:hypothetical protein
MDHVSSKHPAYIENRSEHAGMKAVIREKLNTCKKVQEEITEKIIWH